jgi:autophagy-related protein 2
VPNVLILIWNFVQAYESFTDGLGRTASALIGNPINVYNRGAGARSALTTAICGAPAAVVAPVSATARAVHYALLGIRNR